MKCAIVRLQIPLKDDFVFVVILIFHTINFMVSYPTKFSFIGSISKGMVLNVPSDNLVVDDYRKKPASGVHPMPEDIQKAIDEEN